MVWGLFKVTITMEGLLKLFHAPSPPVKPFGWKPLADGLENNIWYTSDIVARRPLMNRVEKADCFSKKQPAVPFRRIVDLVPFQRRGWVNYNLVKKEQKQMTKGIPASFKGENRLNNLRVEQIRIWNTNEGQAQDAIQLMCGQKLPPKTNRKHDLSDRESFRRRVLCRRK